MAKPKNNNFKSMTKQKSPEEIAKEHQRYAEAGLKRYKHASKDLYKAILAVLPDLKDADGNYNQPAVELSYTACKIFDALGAKSRRFSFSLHHIYTVANPAITDKTNSAYSPVYPRYACGLPQDVSGELDALEEDGAKLVPHRDKIVGDRRYALAGIAEFGSAWDGNGYPVKLDETGAPVRDKWYGSICDKIDALQAASLAKNRRSRHFQAFLVAHTRDERAVLRDAEVALKPRHLQGAVSLADPTTTYHFMEEMGINFNDCTEAFRFIADPKTDQKQDRVKAFLATIQGLLKNFEIPAHWDSTLQYLVHQSAGAIKDDKPPYKVAEVRSWLPDDPTLTYEGIAGVYDNQVVPRGVDQAVLRNLQSPYNASPLHNSKGLIGKKNENKRFTYSQISELRNLGRKKPGASSFTGSSQRNIVNLLMQWIREGKMQVGEWDIALHLAFDDCDADALIGSSDLPLQLDNLVQAEIKAIIGDENYSRNMLTILISGTVGGLGKTFLAMILARYYGKGRKPHAPGAPQPGLTYDPFGDYDNQLASVLDELTGHTLAWEYLKTALEPDSVHDLAARYHNKTPWNVRHTLITNVLADGVAGYARDVLLHAKGVAKLGYLRKDKERGKDAEWHLIANDTTAAKNYLMQLSQLLRRIPIWIELAPANRGHGFTVTVSIANFDPGVPTNHYDYVHTKDSVHRFDNIRLTPDTSKKDLDYVAKTVANMIAAICEKAHAALAANPSALLNDCDGFIADDCDFGIRASKLSGEPVLTENLSRKDAKPLKTTDALPGADSALYQYYDGNSLLLKTFVAFVSRINMLYAYMLRGDGTHHGFDDVLKQSRENGALDIEALTDYLDDKTRIDRFLNLLYVQRDSLLDSDLLTLRSLMVVPKDGQSREPISPSRGEWHNAPDWTAPEEVTVTDNEADDIFG
ncbi:hypothetical protein [uncultured Lacticaseibacillus sp.]|uniref:hypothetical protein n=1 Tax=uncultured Lacticaseibacillus sp. TaxID=2775882 RepID=UPI00259A3BA0|nr:hypothetical protein [uncultured Lacticaseibacillus sp.]